MRVNTRHTISNKDTQTAAHFSAVSLPRQRRWMLPQECQQAFPAAQGWTGECWNPPAEREGCWLRGRERRRKRLGGRERGWQGKGRTGQRGRDQGTWRHALCCSLCRPTHGGGCCFCAEPASISGQTKNTRWCSWWKTIPLGDHPLTHTYRGNRTQHIHTQAAHTYTYAHKHTHPQTHMYTHTHTHTCTHTCIHTQHTWMHKTQTCTHTHTIHINPPHTHTYTHTHSCIRTTHIHTHTHLFLQQVAQWKPHWAMTHVKNHHAPLLSHPALSTQRQHQRLARAWRSPKEQELLRPLKHVDLSRTTVLPSFSD